MFWGWIWIGVIIFAIIIEVITDQLVALWFIPGAIVATILDYFGVHYLWQILVVLILAVVGIVIFRKMMTKFRQRSSNKTNIDAIVGERCIVVERIDTFAGCGQVKIKGQVWSARGIQDDDQFEVGTTLTIVGVEGVKLICK